MCRGAQQDGRAQQYKDGNVHASVDSIAECDHHLELEDKALPSAVVPRRNSPALSCEAAKHVLIAVPHHQNARPHLGSPIHKPIPTSSDTHDKNLYTMHTGAIKRGALQQSHVARG